MNEDSKTPIFGDLLYDKKNDSAQGAGAGSLKPKEIRLNAMIPGGSWEGLSGLLKNSLASLELTTKNVVLLKTKVFKSNPPKSRKPKLREELKIWRSRLSDIRQARRYLELVNEFRSWQDCDLAICHCFTLGRLFERIQVRLVEIDNWTGQKTREGGKKGSIKTLGTKESRESRDQCIAAEIAALIRAEPERKKGSIQNQVARSGRIKLAKARRAWQKYGPPELKGQ